MCFDWRRVGEQLSHLVEGGIDYIHFDMLDGIFAPDFGVGTSIVNSLRKDLDLPADYHLMVENPSRIFQTLTIRPGDIVTLHQEACKNLHRDIMSLKRLGAKVGVALNPATHIHSLDYVIDELDHILLMTVNPGFKGQELVERTISKIGDMREMLDNLGLPATLGVDGNVSLQNVARMVSQGADFLVGGSSGLFVENSQISQSLASLRQAVEDASRP